MIVDEIIIPITDIRLRNGMFRISASKPGPLPAVEATDYVVCDEGGAVVYRSIEGQLGRLSWGRIESNTTLTIVVEVVVEMKVARSLR